MSIGFKPELTVQQVFKRVWNHVVTRRRRLYCSVEGGQATASSRSLQNLARLPESLKFPCIAYTDDSSMIMSELEDLVTDHEFYDSNTLQYRRLCLLTLAEKYKLPAPIRLVRTRRPNWRARFSTRTASSTRHLKS